MTKSPSYNLTFGMDEVGRGCFAGPIVAAAVAFEKDYVWIKNIKDSKLLTHKKRKQLSRLILKNAICFIELIDVDIINKLGIGEANRLIFEKLVIKISKKYGNKNVYFQIDGSKKKIKGKNIDFIVRGDQRVTSISAASIIAKAYRDELMESLENRYPGYNFSKNKGYGTKFHQKAIKKLGLCEIHRKSFNLNKFL